MKMLKCSDPNNNSPYLMDLINSLTYKKDDCYWIITDLDLTPVFKGDHSGVGKEREDSCAEAFLKRIAVSRAERLDYQQLTEILDDTLTIGNAVLTCFKKSYSIDLSTFEPIVETESKIMYNSCAEYEIRILDGDLFFILTE